MKRPARTPRTTRAPRTQADRREGTIRKLLDATIASLVDVGYAGASIQEICRRAGVSHGGLFRHFATREALMVAAGRDVGLQLLEQYRRRFEQLRGREEPVMLAMRLVRDSCRSPINQAWYELSLAARTNPKLRKELVPMARAYFDEIGRMAHQLLPELAGALGPRFAVLIETVIAIFDGETVHRFVLPGDERDRQRIDILAALVRLVAAGAAQ